MRGGMRCIFAGLLLSGLCGCQCCPLTEHYADAVDCIASREHHFECLYHPCHDLTRIGRPDWCQCRINRMLCPCTCARQKPFPHIVEPPVAGGLAAHPQQGERPYGGPTTEPPPEGAIDDTPRPDDVAPAGPEQTPPYVPPATPEGSPSAPAIEPPSAIE